MNTNQQIKLTQQDIKELNKRIRRMQAGLQQPTKRQRRVVVRVTHRETFADIARRNLAKKPVWY